MRKCSEDEGLKPRIAAAWVLSRKGNNKCRKGNAGMLKSRKYDDNLDP